MDDWTSNIVRRPKYVSGLQVLSPGFNTLATYTLDHFSDEQQEDPVESCKVTVPREP